MSRLHRIQLEWKSIRTNLGSILSFCVFRVCTYFHNWTVSLHFATSVQIFVVFRDFEWRCILYLMHLTCCVHSSLLVLIPGLSPSAVLSSSSPPFGRLCISFLFCHVSKAPLNLRSTTLHSQIFNLPEVSLYLHSTGSFLQASSHCSSFFWDISSPLLLPSSISLQGSQSSSQKPP